MLTPCDLFFFFSSRRRHTRCYRDWSSDVCSSDLGIGDLYDRYEVGDLWLPQHGEKLAVAGNYEEFERVRHEHPDERTFWPKGSRSVWTTLGEGDLVAVRCFSPPGYIDPEEQL